MGRRERIASLLLLRDGVHCSVSRGAEARREEQANRFAEDDPGMSLLW